MADTKKNPVIIAGGGIGGLGAALALARAGLPSLVLEQSETFGEIGAGIQLGPNVFRMFEALGIEEIVSKTAVFVEKLTMMDSLTGRQIMEVPLGDAFRERFGKPYAVIHRADLHRAILEVCEAEELITLKTGVKVSGFNDDGNSVVVKLEDGSTVAGRALIGADGLWSTVRKQLLDDGKPRLSGHIAYRAVLPLDEVPEELRQNAATLWAGPRTHLVHYPLRNWELFNLVAVFHSEAYTEGWNAVGAKDELHRRFADVHHLPRRMIDKIDEWRMWVLCDREPVSEWSAGNVTLLGDAAHPMLQYLAQGACMALEDAVCLAGKIIETEEDYPAAFQAYQEERYLRTGRVQLTARWFGEIYHASGVTRELRNEMLTPREGEARDNPLAWLYDGP